MGSEWLWSFSKRNSTDALPQKQSIWKDPEKHAIMEEEELKSARSQQAVWTVLPGSSLSVRLDESFMQEQKSLQLENEV